MLENTIPFPGEHAPAANPEEQSDVSFPFLPGGAPPASTTPNPNRSQQPQPHLCSIRPRSPASGSSSHLGSLSGFRRAGLEGSQGLPELKLSALLSLNPLQNPSKNPSRSSLTAPPQKLSLGTIPLQTQRLGCSRSLFFSQEKSLPLLFQLIPATFQAPAAPKAFPNSASNRDKRSTSTRPCLCESRWLRSLGIRGIC